MMINTSKNRRILRRRKTGVKEDVSGVRTVFNKIGARFLLVFLLMITFFSGYAAGMDSFSVSSASGGYEDNQVIWTELSNQGVGVVLPMVADTSDTGITIGTPLDMLDMYVYSNPPSAPIRPSGTASSCLVRVPYEYSTSAIDPDGDQVKYIFDWGDKSSDTTGLIDSGAEARASHTWTKPGTYYVKAQAVDLYGWGSDWSPKLKVTVVNTLPDPPRKPSGPSSGQVGISYTYETSAEDPDGDQVKYIFDWGDGKKSTTDPVNSEDPESASHIWTKPGTYNVKAQAEDRNSAKSEWSTVLEVTIENTPPDKPGAPSGPPLGQPGISYTYYASTTDPNGDQITYVFDWGDGTTSMTEAVGPGELVSLPHAWAKFGEYGVRVNATDSNGESSEWSEPLVVVVGAEEQIPPVAIIAAAPMELIEGETVSFGASESSDENGEIVSYDWDFGDGSAGTGVNVEHTYARSGQYTTTLTVTDNDGLSATNGVSITVGSESLESDPSNMYPTTPSAPQNPQATPGEGYVGLKWDEPGDDGGAAITNYRIYRSTAPGGGTLLTTVGNVLAYTDNDVTNDQQYYYQIGAVNSAGEGARSKEASVKAFETGGGLDMPIIAAIITALAIIVAAIINYLPSRKRYGSISVTSSPDGVRVFLDGADKGESPVTLDKIRKGTHIVLFSKSGYSDCEKRVVVNADQITSVHCDLKKLEMKLRLSAEPTEIPADGKSKSVITISVEGENGTPAPVPEEVTIVLETNIGLIDTPARIPAGDAQTRSILTSSTAGGTATVKAKSGTGLEGSIEVRFA